MSYPLFLFRLQSLLLKKHTKNSYSDSTFRFNGKEWDEETGNYYYGARYYDPKISLRLSVDPMAHEFPHVYSYNFSLNSAINLVDADGYTKGSSRVNGNGWALNNILILGTKIKVFGKRFP